MNRTNKIMGVKARIILLLVCLTVVLVGRGCSGEDPEVEKAKIRSNLKVIRQLPDDAVIVEEHGGYGWCVFKLKVLGKDRYFFFKRNSGGYTGYEAITELKE